MSPEPLDKGTTSQHPGCVPTLWGLSHAGFTGQANAGHSPFPVRRVPHGDTRANTHSLLNPRASNLTPPANIPLTGAALRAPLTGGPQAWGAQPRGDHVHGGGGQFPRTLEPVPQPLVCG